jgi:predicted NACHT family NTPase
MGQFIDWIMQDPKSRIPIVVALIGLTGTIIGGLFTIVVWPLLKMVLERIWGKLANGISGREFENRYLDWVIREHEYLPILPTTLLPVTEKQPKELDKLYVSLALIDSTKTSQDISIGSALNNYPKLVVLGDPGAGKTTTLRFMALTLARARRGVSLRMSTKERKDEQQRIQIARHTVKWEFHYKDYPIPIFVYLSRLKNLVNLPNRSLLDLLRDEWSMIDSLGNLPLEFLKDKLRQGECVFLLDGFDELATQETRELISRRIGELAAAFPRGNRFVVSSRIVGYRGQLSDYGFNVVTIQKLSWQRISELVRNWYSYLHEGELAEELLTTLQANPRIHELAINPMLLSLIALVQHVRRLIPDRRHVLYDECVKILVERRYAPPYIQEIYNRVLPSEEAMRLLKQIALAMHRANRREVPREIMENQIILSVLKKMRMSRAATISPVEILRNIEQRSQLLVERGFDENGQPIVAFSHLTFQEFLVSVALKEAIALQGEASISVKLLRDYEQNPHQWEEVALLYAAQLDDQQQEAFFTRLYPGTSD